MSRLVVLLLLAVAGGACREKAPPPAFRVVGSASATVASTERPPPPQAVPTDPGAAALGIVWVEPPAGFEKVSAASTVRKASYRVTRAAGDQEDGELGVFYFGPSEGGAVEANIQRWISQFEGVRDDAVKRATEQRNGLVHHTIEIPRGTFRAQVPGGPSQDKPGFALLGAVVEAPDGRYFFKLTGPEKTVQNASSGFRALLQSVKPR